MGDDLPMARSAIVVAIVHEVVAARWFKTTLDDREEVHHSIEIVSMDDTLFQFGGGSTSFVSWAF